MAADGSTPNIWVDEETVAADSVRNARNAVGAGTNPAAEVAGTAGGVSAGANNAGMGDLESASRDTVNTVATPGGMIGIPGGRGATGGGSNANMDGATGMTTGGTAGGTTAAATTGDIGISDSGALGDLGATTAGPEGDFGSLADQESAAVTAGAVTGGINDEINRDERPPDVTREASGGLRTPQIADTAGGGATAGGAAHGTSRGATPVMDEYTDVEDLMGVDDNPAGIGNPRKLLDEINDEITETLS